MFLKIKDSTFLKFKEIDNYFPKNYIEQFFWKESIYARYILSKEINKIYWIKNYFPKNDNNWKPIFESNFFWSLSHKNNLIFIWINDKNIWIDIEIYKERDLSILNIFSDEEYILLLWKNWYSFYIIWTAKESVIKYNLWNLDDMKYIKLIWVIKSKKLINKLNFDLILILQFKWQNNNVIFWRKNFMFYSVCTVF